MYDLVINGVSHEITERRIEQLSATGAIVRGDGGEWELNPSHSFTYQEVLWLMDASEIDGEE